MIFLSVLCKNIIKNFSSLSSSVCMFCRDTTHIDRERDLLFYDQYVRERLYCNYQIFPRKMPEVSKIYLKRVKSKSRPANNLSSFGGNNMDRKHFLNSNKRSAFYSILLQKLDILMKQFSLKFNKLYKFENFSNFREINYFQIIKKFQWD